MPLIYNELNIKIKAESVTTCAESSFGLRQKKTSVIPLGNQTQVQEPTSGKANLLTPGCVKGSAAFIVREQTGGVGS